MAISEDDNIAKLQEYYNQALDWAVVFAPKALLAICVLVIGFRIIHKINGVVRHSLESTRIAVEISSFLGSMLDVVMRFAVIMFAAGMIGFEVSSLLGVLAAAGFAVGLALQGFLGNFASGITIVFFKPYGVGDWIEVGEKFGKVVNIQMFSTTLITPGSKVVIIPNGQVTGGCIINFSTMGKLRLELNVPVPYAESFPRLRQVILDALRSVPEVIAEPEPEIGIERYDSHNLVLAVRPFIQPDNYWSGTFACNEAIKRAFHANGIQIAYPEGIELGTIGE
jgi:small conductance mechanosensitive channel